MSPDMAARRKYTRVGSSTHGVRVSSSHMLVAPVRKLIE